MAFKHLLVIKDCGFCLNQGIQKEVVILCYYDITESHEFSYDVKIYREEKVNHNCEKYSVQILGWNFNFESYEICERLFPHFFCLLMNKVLMERIVWSNKLNRMLLRVSHFRETDNFLWEMFQIFLQVHVFGQSFFQHVLHSMKLFLLRIVVRMNQQVDHLLQFLVWKKIVGRRYWRYRMTRS